jgi:FPC/CPF motif-containing protein YcgG
MRFQRKYVMRQDPFTVGNTNPSGERSDSFAVDAELAFREFVLRPEFPCVGAKAALNSSSYSLAVYDELGSAAATTGLSAALCDFARSTSEPPPALHGAPHETVPRSSGEYATFVAIFARPRSTDEVQFETLLWKQLRALLAIDNQSFGWDPHVSSDPADPHFSFSFAGQALYVIGLHANSSRPARRFPWPALVFNPHEQFERLRTDGKWKRMQETIRNRELELHGSINPMLSDFGEQSEARQYSGRAVDEHWNAPFPKAAGKCPFGHGP